MGNCLYEGLVVYKELSLNTGSVFYTNPNRAKRLEELPDQKYRTNFQRDRDRVLYSRAFRRLAGKTQVFLATEDDHVRNRLTHTLEVSQIATTISKALGLNVELTEAIALAHDIGHTPFGHVGERTLNFIMNGCYKIKKFNSDLPNEVKGFKHNWQGVRVVSQLEDEPLNLTNYTLWGILNHSNLKYGDCNYCAGEKCNLRHENDLCRYDGKSSLLYYEKELKDINSIINLKDSWSFEGCVVSIADEIAQRHHDIEDALIFNLVPMKKIVEIIEKNFNNVLDDNYKNILKQIKEENKNGVKSKTKQFKKISTIIVDTLAKDAIEQSKQNLLQLQKAFEINSNDDFYNKRNAIKAINSLVDVNQVIRFSKPICDADDKLKEFLRDIVLNSFKAQRMDGLGKHVIKELFKAYLENPQQLPDDDIVDLYKNLMSEDGLCEYKEDGEIVVGDLRNKLEKDHNKYFTDNKYKYALLRTICDYIAGMTDKYALSEHKRLYNC